MKLFKFSKQDLLGKAASALGVAAVCHFLFGQWGGDLFAVPFFFVALFFGAWWFQKFYRDISAARPDQFHSIREVHADYQQPLELMSRGSKGLPTNFD